MRALWLVVLAAGCAGELGHNDYVDQRAAVECRKLEKCALGMFESEYRDLEGCEEDVADLLDDLEDTVFNDCDFDGSEASACISRLGSMGCEAYAEGDASEACDLVWDCDAF